MVTSITVSDERTKVTKIFLVKNSDTSGQRHSVAYRVKGYSSDKLLNPTNKYDYVGFESTREDEFYAITNDGRKHVVTIGTDGLWEGLQTGFTKSTGKSKSEDDISTKKAIAAGAASAIAGEAASAIADEAKNAILDSLPWPINWIITLLWWIIKGIWWIISLPFKFIWSLFHD